MTLLHRQLRIHQIFGANTNVGKTIFATALVRASAHCGHHVLYLKPISTGDVGDADDLYESSVNFPVPPPKILIPPLDRHVRRFSDSFSGLVEVGCLFRYSEPISPHLAVLRQEGAGQVSISFPTPESGTNAYSTGLRWCFSQCDKESLIIIH